MGVYAERDMGLESGLECVAVVYQAVGSGGEAIAGDGGWIGEQAKTSDWQRESAIH